MYPVQQYVGEKKIDTLSLHIYHVDGLLVSTLYEDEGEGYGYQQGQFNWLKFEVEGTTKTFTIKRKTEHEGHKTSYNQYEIFLHGLPFNPMRAQIDGEKIEMKYTKRSYVFRFNCKKEFNEIKIS